MMGMPSETAADMQTTAVFIKKFMRNHPYNMFNINPFTPLPNTGIWDTALAQGAVRQGIPWNEFGFSLTSFDTRSYTLNPQIGNKEISHQIKKLFSFRRRIFYKNLLFKNPLQFLRALLQKLLP